MTETECKKEKLEELMNKCELNRQHYDEVLALYQEQVLLCKECPTPCGVDFEEQMKKIEAKRNV